MSAVSRALSVRTSTASARAVRRGGKSSAGRACMRSASSSPFDKFAVIQRAHRRLVARDWNRSETARKNSCAADRRTISTSLSGGIFARCLAIAMARSRPPSCIDQPVILRLLPGPHAPLRDRVDLLGRAVPGVGDLLDELIVESLQLFLQLSSLRRGCTGGPANSISACLPILVDSMRAPSFS